MCLDIGTPKTIDVLFGTNGKLTVLGVLILKHIAVEFWMAKNYSFSFLIEILGIMIWE